MTLACLSYLLDAMRQALDRNTQTQVLQRVMQVRIGPCDALPQLLCIAVHHRHLRVSSASMSHRQPSGLQYDSTHLNQSTAHV